MALLRVSVPNRSPTLHALRAPAVPPQATATPYQADTKKNVVVIGGGWAGFGAAKHLAEQGYAVTLLDGSANPGGLSAGWRTPQGRAVEAGVKGFWYQYHNIFRLVDELALGDVFTPWSTSGFWSPQGLTTQAPVFSELPRFPTLLGQFLHTAPLFRSLSLADRATMVPLLYAVLDFDSDPETYARYDRMSALELFQRFGVSKALYEQFLKPLLLVGLFAPPEQLSAADMLATFYFYALAHQNDFDVKWCRGSVSEKIITPLVDRIRSLGAQVLGSRLVTDVQVDEGSVRLVAVVARDPSGTESRYPADAVVFAIGITGMQKLVSSCPALAAREEFRSVMNLQSIDCIATRLWFDRRVSTRFPANVLSGFEPFNTGATFFDLNALQDEYKSEQGSVIAADFYHSNPLMPVADADIIKLVHKNISICEPDFAAAQVVDSAVLRFPKAVTHFSPGSYASRPQQATSFPNAFIAGDWVKDVPHGSNGLSQERAYVTGLLAANLVVGRLGVGQPAVVLPTEAEEPQMAAAREANRLVKSSLGSLGLRLPFFEKLLG